MPCEYSQIFVNYCKFCYFYFQRHRCFYWCFMKMRRDEPNELSIFNLFEFLDLIFFSLAFGAIMVFVPLHNKPPPLLSQRWIDKICLNFYTRMWGLANDNSERAQRERENQFSKQIRVDSVGWLNCSIFISPQKYY